VFCYLLCELVRFECEPDLIETRIESQWIMSSTVISSRSAFVSI